MIEGKQIGGCSILVAGMLGYSRSYCDGNSRISRESLLSNSQLVVSSIYDKISAPKDITNVMEEIKKPSTLVKDISINICSRVCNKNANRVAKSANV